MLWNGRVMAEKTFEAIVETHHAEIHRYLRRVISRASEADRLFQETFLRAFRAYRSLPADANVRAWLFAIATRLCRTHARSIGRRLATQSTSVEGIIRCLPVVRRLAFTMRKLHDLDYNAIGTSLDCSTERARDHVFQAMRQLRRRLDGFALPEAARRLCRASG